MIERDPEDVMAGMRARVMGSVGGDSWGLSFSELLRFTNTS